MDELIALQQELANVQSAKAGFKLSEPNVVEVVQKMVEMGLLEVLYTSNGKEYVTPKRLHEEVADEILAHGGRINITELPPILNVDLPHIERAVDQLLKKDGGLQLYQGDILASYYLDSLAEDVHQALQAAGRVTIGDLAMQYNFSSEFMSKLVEPRLGTLIHAKLSGNALYTSAYTDRHAARVRGVLSALTRPASLPQLVREHAFSEALFHDPNPDPALTLTLTPPPTLTPAPTPTLMIALTLTLTIARRSSTRRSPSCTRAAGCPARCRARPPTHPRCTCVRSRPPSAASTSRTASSSTWRSPSCRSRTRTPTPTRTSTPTPTSTLTLTRILTLKA